MNRKELERAWPAAEPSPGFSDRVLDRARRAPAAPEASGSSDAGSPRTSGPRWRPARPLRWLALSAAALALAAGAVVAFEATRPALDGDVIAAEPRTVSLGERAVAELSSGAHVRWSGEGAQLEVQQDRGEATYRVEPGGRFAVQTPYGSVSVLGTVFRVVVADPNQPGGEPMKKRWGIVGAGASLAALLFVSVERGNVRIATAEHALEVGAGEAASVGADGVPRREATAQAASGATGAAAVEAERQRNRRVADAVRRHAAKRREAARAAKPGAEAAVASETAAAEPAPPPVMFRPQPQNPQPERTPEEQRQRDYIQRTVHEQYFPVARDCYNELLARQPKAGGRVTLEFAIVGDADAGVVDRVSLRDDDKDSIEDPEFRLCMTESMYTAVFEPPPPGANETTVVYPIMLAPE
ncbi:MAG TPA: AgmX/PglI C-terminal domain-containing protein [Polyangiaceae bacterium]|nr:AgmX/PglI C-terminal domain-containing protein [Polyangiaceae bacterium]